MKVSDEKGTLIQAPAAGYVSQLSVAPGDYVEMGQPLATIAKSGGVQLRAMVSQRYFSLLPSLTDATFRTPASDACYRVSELGGRLYTSRKNHSGRLLPRSRGLRVRCRRTFPRRSLCRCSAARPGTRRRRFRSPLGPRPNSRDSTAVDIQLDADCYRRQQVWRGGDDGVNVEILRGLEGGERIVTRGAVNVKMASASDAIPHGHTH